MAAKQITPRVLVLLALAVAAGMVLVALWRPGTADITGGAPGMPRDPVAAGQADPAVPPPLGLEDMEAARAAPANRRDLFRFGQVQPDPDEIAAGAGESRPPGQGTAVAEPPVELGPPQPAPIPLRYVIFAETAGVGRVAGLSDGRFTYHAREGDVIEGKWRVVTITAESVVIERVDGTGRQTLRLAGG